MSLCINPDCPQPNHPGNDRSDGCQSCGGSLLLQGRYRVMRQLSHATGFGTVYEAYERNVPKILKVLKRERAKTPKVLELFRQEAAVLSRIRHPGVPYVEDGYFTVPLPDSPEVLHCIVMEKIDGLNLRQWMRQQGNHPISEQQAIQWLTQLTDILHRIHQQNFFHRDIKPDNVMVRANGQLVLVDFGAAREMTYTYLAQVGSQGGITQISSAGYTPPEQEQGQAVPQSDFYALGRTVIYLLTTFAPNDAAIYDPLLNWFNWRPHAPQVADDFAHLLDSLIAPRVIDRPATAQAILDALQQLAITRWATPHLPAGGADTVLPETTLPPTSTSPTEIAPVGNSDDVTLAEDYWAEAAVGGTAMAAANAPSPVPDQAPGLLQSEATATAPLSQLQSWSDGRGRNQLRWGRWLGALVGIGAIAGVGLWWGYRQHSQPPSEVITSTAVPTRAAQPQQVLSDHTSPVNALVLLPDNRRLLSAGADKTILLWDITTGEVLQSWSDQTSFVNTLSLSPDETTLYSGTADGALQAWSLADGSQRWQQTIHAGALNALTLSPDGQTLVSGGADGILHVLKAASGASLHTIAAHQGAVNTVAITADGQHIISGGSDRDIRIWSLATGEARATLTGHESFVNHLIVSPDGRTLFSASADETIRQWDLDQGTLMRTLMGHTSYVNVLALSRDGRFLASGSADATVRTWEVETGRPIAAFTGFNTTVDYLVLTPDRLLITASRNQPTITLWTLD
jgi:serine/threonine protein kinase/sugar lactone lactonase YvrE